MTKPQRFNSYAPIRRPSRRGNPYFNNRAEALRDSLLKNILAKITPRAWFFIITFFIIIGALIWLFLVSNIILVQKIEIRGNILVSGSSIEEMAFNQTKEKRWLFFGQDRWFVFNGKKLAASISDRYKINTVTIRKKLPDTITVEIKEKTAAAVWFEADTYWQIDAEGWILAQATGSQENLPTIYNNGQPRILDQKINVDQSVIAAAGELAKEWPVRFASIPIKQLVIDQELLTIKLYPARGAMVYFNTNDSISSQLNRLEILLASELKGRFEKLTYIDLRFADRVYYK